MREIHKTLRVGAIVGLAWMVAGALTPMTSVAIRNSTIDSSAIGNVTPSTVRATWSQIVNAPPNPVPSNSMTLGWNGTLGGGEADIVLNHGTGSTGGLSFYEAPSGTWTPSSPTIHWDKTGAFFAATSVNAPSIVGTLTGNVIGNVTGNLNGSVTGNVTGNVTGALNGNAATASAFNHTPAVCPAGQVVQAISSTGAPTCVTSVQSAGGPGGVTGGSSFSSTTSVVPLSPGYADANYQASCTLVAPSDPRAVMNGITNKSATSLTVEVATMGSVSISYAGVDCLIHHP